MSRHWPEKQGAYLLTGAWSLWQVDIYSLRGGPPPPPPPPTTTHHHHNCLPTKSHLKESLQSEGQTQVQVRKGVKYGPGGKTGIDLRISFTFGVGIAGWGTGYSTWARRCQSCAEVPRVVLWVTDSSTTSGARGFAHTAAV